MDSSEITTVLVPTGVLAWAEDNWSDLPQSNNSHGRSQCQCRRRPRR